MSESYNRYCCTHLNHPHDPTCIRFFREHGSFPEKCRPIATPLPLPKEGPVGPAIGPNMPVPPEILQFEREHGSDLSETEEPQILVEYARLWQQAGFHAQALVISDQVARNLSGQLTLQDGFDDLEALHRFRLSSLNLLAEQETASQELLLETEATTNLLSQLEKLSQVRSILSQSQTGFSR